VGQTFRSHSEETAAKAKSVKQQPFTNRDRVSCEVNSIGATGVKPPLLGRTTICIGTRTADRAQRESMNGSDYVGLPSSLLCPNQIVTTMDGKFERKNGESAGNGYILIMVRSCYTAQSIEDWACPL